MELNTAPGMSSRVRLDCAAVHAAVMPLGARAAPSVNLLCMRMCCRRGRWLVMCCSCAQCSGHIYAVDDAVDQQLFCLGWPGWASAAAAAGGQVNVAVEALALMFKEVMLGAMHVANSLLTSLSRKHSCGNLDHQQLHQIQGPLLQGSSSSG
ncbi:hypothetical protein COO60DRAFT_1578106 [Scenedesmus sp. NREL 46B-D3]|nr:hypothetical protein COO60DRAFT_1578106 [Scenedesmus sp. NREL 46B-D3]